MDFSTINFHDSASLMKMFQPALVTAAAFDDRLLMTRDHVGSAYRKLPARHASHARSHRHATDLHRHVWLEMCLPLAGQCAIETIRGVYPMPRSSLAVFSPGMFHCERRMKTDSEHALLWVCFSKAYVIVMPSLHKANGVWETPMRWTVAGRIAAQMSQALPLLDELDSIHLERFRLALLAMLGEVCRQAIESPPRRRGTENSLDHHHVLMLRQLEHFVVQHLDQPIRLKQLASIAHLSPNHLNTLFRKWSGMPVHKWIIHKRMEKAMALLKQPGSLAKQVALAVGYDDPLYFSRAFHRYHNQWPSDVKRQGE